MYNTVVTNTKNEMEKIISNCIILLLLFSSCNSQTKSNPETLKIEEFNWTVIIPENFEPINQEEWNKTLNKGINAIEDTFEEEVDNQATTIFTYKNGQFNNFEANWQPFDIEIDGGINFENCSKAKKAGANILVSGSTIFKENKGDLKKNIEILRNN